MARDKSIIIRRNRDIRLNFETLCEKNYTLSECISELSEQFYLTKRTIEAIITKQHPYG